MKKRQLLPCVREMYPLDTKKSQPRGGEKRKNNL